MLNKLHSFAYELFVLQSGVLLTVCFIDLMGDQRPCPSYALHMINAFVSIGMILAWSCLRKVKAKEHSARWRPIWCGLERKYVILRALSTVFVTFSTMWLALMVFAFACAGYSSVILTISNCAYSAGAYESAEWWYKQKSDRKLGETTSLGKASSVAEAKRERNLRNNAVAKIYGASSLECAQRYFFVGSNIEMSNRNGQGYNDEALSWFEKSFEIAKVNRYNGLALNDLCQMALIKFDQKRFSECHSYIFQAHELLSRFPQAHSAMSSNSRILLGYMAGRLGDLAFATTFEKTPIHVKSHERFLDATKVAILLALAFVPPLFSRLGLISPLLAEILVVVLDYRSRKRLMKSADINTSMATLNRLIDLDLYRGDYPGALRHSENLLQLASLGVIPYESTKTGFKWHNRVGLLLGQQILATTAFVVLFAISFR